MKINDILHHWTNTYNLIGKVTRIEKEGRVTCNVIKDNNNNWSLENFSFNPEEDNHKIYSPKRYPEYQL